MSHDCLRCGACCFSNLETYVRVTGEDWTRLGPDVAKWAHFIGNRAYLRMNGGHCAGLELRRDEIGKPVYFCRLYERRPSVCRELESGSSICDAERCLKDQSRRSAALFAESSPP